MRSSRELMERMAKDLAELLSLRTRDHVHGTISRTSGDLTRGGGIFRGAEQRGHRIAEQILRDADGPGRAPTGSGSTLASPLDPRHTVDRHGPPETQRRSLVDDYIATWEREEGRAITPEEREMLTEGGCIGLAKLRLGLTGVETEPPMNLAFADPSSHRAIQPAVSFLAPGEAANANVKRNRRLLAEAEKSVTDNGNSDSATDRIRLAEQNLEESREQAREVWSSLDKSDIRDMLLARNEARITGNTRTFERVMDHVQRFRDILAGDPKDGKEFLRRVTADPVLSQLRGVDRYLPSGAPSEWKLKVFSKHFWSGQDMVRDSDGFPVFKEEGGIETVATHAPDPARFEPDPSTGQVDMFGDFNRNRPGCLTFDYGVYEEDTGRWLTANHMDYRTAPEYGDASTDPMVVEQCAPEKFYASSNNFDSSVICIAFTKASQ